MQSRGMTWVLLAGWLVAALVLSPTGVFAQDGVTMEELDDWFYSRLSWGAIIGAFLGVVVGLFHLCRLEFEVRSRNVDLSVDRSARRKFGAWVLIIFFIGGIFLFLDTWLIYEFGDISLGVWEALGRVWLNYRTLVILLATLASFALLVALVTRLKSDCRCRYAFIPGPQGK